MEPFVRKCNKWGNSMHPFVYVIVCVVCPQVTASQCWCLHVVRTSPKIIKKTPTFQYLTHRTFTLRGKKLPILGITGFKYQPKKKRGKLHLQFMIKGWSIFNGLLPRKLLCTLKNFGSKTALQLKCLLCRGNSLVSRGVMVSLVVSREWCRFWRLNFDLL